MSSPPSATPPPAADGPATPPGATGGVATAGAPAAHSLGATKAYGSGDTEVLALNDVTVAFPSGRFTAIMGPSGSGKSTLMHCMAGLDTLTAGQVFIGDTDLSTLSDKQRTLLRREHVGFVFQAFNLIPTLTASENITLPLDLGGTKPDQGWLDTVVNTVGLSDRLSHRPSELSGGQQQRVAVARAMATWFCSSRSAVAGNPGESTAPGHWSLGRRSSSPTSRPATSTRPRGPRCSASCVRRSTTTARPW